MTVEVRMSAAAEAPVLTDETERLVAEQSSRELAGLADRALRIRVEGSRKTITLPAAAVRLLADLLAQMARGNAVALVPYQAELTTQQAADLLGVSRPFLVGLLERREIPYRKVGAHRRVRLEDLVKYQDKTRRSRHTALRELAALDQELGLE
jgi:excisionase family DNA binding protein